MNKPEGYDDIKVNFETRERLSLGGHRCIVMKVIEKKSSTGKEQLEIHLDTAPDDAQPMYFSNQFMSNGSGTWPCRVWITGYETSDFGKSQLKKFHTAIEDSNANFFIQWGPTYVDSLKGKRVGVVFGQEENEWNGRISTLTKPRYFRGILDVEKAEIPKKKTIRPETPEQPNVTSEGFMQVQDGLEDEGLPFN